MRMIHFKMCLSFFVRSGGGGGGDGDYVTSDKGDKKSRKKRSKKSKTSMKRAEDTDSERERDSSERSCSLLHQEWKRGRERQQ